MLVAGVGGASLGTEILKSLSLADRYAVFACDISPLAYGHFVSGLEDSFVVDPTEYTSSVLDVCRRREIRLIVAGAEGAAVELAASFDQIASAGITVVGNSPDVVRLCSDKTALFERLRQIDGLDLPWTAGVSSVEELRALDGLPSTCIVKPSTGSGGSSSVFLATSSLEVETYVRLLTAQGRPAVVQEYVPDDEGEFTIGVLSLPDGSVAGSIALRRLFHAKLSVLSRSSAGLISSGYSQGLIDDFPGLRRQAELLAQSLDSVGPLNVQARVRRGSLSTFEINARFSASTYLRAMAGFNEVDALLGFVAFGEVPELSTTRPGYYLRSLSEIHVSPEDVPS